MAKSKNEYGIVVYSYFCKKCAKNFKYQLSFEEWRDEDLACPICHQKLKYLTSQDIREGNNINYISAEKVSDQNKKRIGEEAYKEMCEADPVVKGRMDWKKEEKPWWRAGMDKPLKLSDIKDTEKYIMTGDKN
jgi:uncharacterized protein YbaR (Trm112 family)